jgi:hypothetical protein
MSAFKARVLADPPERRGSVGALRTTHTPPAGWPKVLANFVRMLNNLDARLADIAACNNA